jgi:hypothetical protein
MKTTSWGLWAARLGLLLDSRRVSMESGDKTCRMGKQ